MKRVFSSQVSVFQRGGSVVCRSTGSGSCTAEQQQLPLSITVALNSEVSIKGFQVGKLNTGDFLTNSDTEQCHSMSCIKVFVNGWHFRDVVERAAYEMCIYIFYCAPCLYPVSMVTECSPHMSAYYSNIHLHTESEYLQTESDVSVHCLTEFRGSSSDIFSREFISDICPLQS